MRVLHIINGLHAGGAEALLYRLATKPSHVQHEVISLLGPEWYSSSFAEQGITVHHMGIRSPAKAVAALPKLFRIVKSSRADVVQTWMYRSNVYGGAVARAAGRPVVWGVHTGSLEPLRFVQRLWVYAGGLAARFVPNYIINCSERSARVHAQLGYAAAPGGVVPNGYDPGLFYPDESLRELTRQQLGVRPDLFTIGFIRRWAPAKDVPTLVHALRIIREHGIPFRAIFVGDKLDPGNFELMQLLRDNSCDGAVTLLGRRSDIPEIARAIDLHVLSSLVEAFPNIVAETMLSGTPNVVTDVGDSGLMVGDSGWVVPTRQPAKLANEIEMAYAEWNEDPERWQQRRLRARRLIADRFTFERMADEYERVWLEVVAAHRGSNE